MQLRYAAWYVASFAPAAFIPWICGSDDSMTLLVKSMEFIVMAPTRAVSARTWSPMIGEAVPALTASGASSLRSEEHTSELQSRLHLVCRLLLEKKKKKIK